jgi:hypothetical protein
VIGLLATVFGPLGRWALLALGVLAAVFAIRRSGKSAGRAEINTEILEDTKHAMEIRKEAEREVSAAGDAELDEWLRPPRHRGAADRRQR